MDWQIIVVGILVFGSALGLILKIRRNIKKTQSFCNSCMMKDGCNTYCKEEQQAIFK